jgi:hypothetical protein
MIIFDLACQNGHRFEGWFQSREDFDSQLAASLRNSSKTPGMTVR